MDIQAEICRAIQSKNTIQFLYKGNSAHGNRIVEPHMIALNAAGHLSLSAWFLHGVSESNRGPGWRGYLVAYISNVIVLPGVFPGPRPGYQPSGGQKFHNVRCAL